MTANGNPKPSILVVDDTPENIDVLKETLKDDYLIRPALNGELALRIAQSANPPDLILLDVMMPGMDGHEVMRRLQGSPATREIPVIFVTAITDMEGELTGLELGAVDYITKPINPSIVKARVHTQLALRKTQLILKQRNEALLEERELVEDIITRMRTSKFFDNRHLRYLISSVDRTNGDILLATFTPDDRQWILVGDITGHGLPAAVAAPLISHVFYSRAGQGSPVEMVLDEINAVMCRQLPINIFMVGCLLEISPDRREIALWNAGMPTGLLVEDGKIVRRIVPTILPFGISEKVDMRQGGERFQVSEDTRFYVFSDGVTEVADPQGELFGVPRMEAFVSGLTAGENSLDGLLACLESFHGNAEFDDDVTLVEISC